MCWSSLRRAPSSPPTRATVPIPFFPLGSVHPPFCVVTSLCLFLLSRALLCVGLEELWYIPCHRQPASQTIRLLLLLLLPNTPTTAPYSNPHLSSVSTATNRVLSVCPSDYSISDTYLPRCVVYTHSLTQLSSAQFSPIQFTSAQTSPRVAFSLSSLRVVRFS